MSIQVGDPLPEVALQRIREGVETIDTKALFDGRKVVLFAVPGAFTPTCSEKHLPGFVQHFEEFRRKGVEVACMAVNDPFVMQAWGKSQHVPDGLIMLADGNADFTRALGLEMDASAYGMGMRSKPLRAVRRRWRGASSSTSRRRASSACLRPSTCCRSCRNCIANRDALSGLVRAPSFPAKAGMTSADRVVH